MMLDKSNSVLKGLQTEGIILRKDLDELKAVMSTGRAKLETDRGPTGFFRLLD